MEDLHQRLSSGAWKVAEERAAARGAPLPRRVAGAAAPTLQGQLGLPNRIERLIRIERETERAERRLRDQYAVLARDIDGDATAFAQVWRRIVERTSFLEVNDLIDEHHEWFPIEASLRWDMTLEDFRAPFGIPWRKRRLDAAWALERLPPELERARAVLAEREASSAG